MEKEIYLALIMEKRQAYHILKQEDDFILKIQSPLESSNIKYIEFKISQRAAKKLALLILNNI